MSNLAKNTIFFGALLLFLAVLIGAFGAHALAELLEKNNRVDVFSIASRYHFYHGFALLMLGMLMQLYQGIALPKVTGLCFIFGVILFSGSLYFLAIFNVSWLGAIAPIGGAFLLFGWLLLAYSMFKESAVKIKQTGKTTA